MNEKVETYLTALGLSEPVLARVTTLIGEYELLLKSAIDDCFVSEYISDDAGRVFEALFVFLNGLMGEAKIPENGGDRLDLVPLNRSVRHWILEKKAYGLTDADEYSRLKMDVWLGDNRVATLRASGANCNALTEIGAAYFLPNLAPLPTTAATTKE